MCDLVLWRVIPFIVISNSVANVRVFVFGLGSGYGWNRGSLMSEARTTEDWTRSVLINFQKGHKGRKRNW